MLRPDITRRAPPAQAIRRPSGGQGSTRNQRRPFVSGQTQPMNGRPLARRVPEIRGKLDCWKCRKTTVTRPTLRTWSQTRRLRPSSRHWRRLRREGVIASANAAQLSIRGETPTSVIRSSDGSDITSSDGSSLVIRYPSFSLSSLVKLGRKTDEGQIVIAVMPAILGVLEALGKDPKALGRAADRGEPQRRGGRDRLPTARDEPPRHRCRLASSAEQELVPATRPEAGRARAHRAERCRGPCQDVPAIQREKKAVVRHLTSGP